MLDHAHPQHPDITAEKWIQIDKIISDNKELAGAVITVLRECQDVVGYLPIELIDYISDGLNLSRSEVFAVDDFFNPFDIAGRAHADLNLVTAFGHHGKKRIKRCNPKDFAA